jgi:glycosyltransferase involved in cell wall biosynthesis
MKVVINALSARLGGGQTYIMNLLAHLPDRSDLKVHVFAPRSLVISVDSRIVRRTTRWPTENPLLRTLWEVIFLPKLLARENAQVLFCPGGVIATRAPRRCKTATMFRNMIPFDPGVLGKLHCGWQKARNFLLRRAMLRSMSKADLTIFISEHARAMIERLVSVPKAVTIPHGISESFSTFDKELRRPTWLPSGEYLLYVSRFDVYKHQFEVAQAYCRLPHELRSRYSLLFVGEYEKHQAEAILQLAANSDAGAQIRIAGAVPYVDLPAAYRHASANIFASSCENCPNILLEALGAGRPVLSSRVMPMPEFGGDAAEYFDPADPASIREALTRVLTSDDRRCELSELAARRSKDFDWSKSARETWLQIEMLIAS